MDGLGRFAARFFAFVTWVWTCGVLLLGLMLGEGLRCDESCGQGSGWGQDPHAWQWHGLTALGAGAFLGGVAFLVLIWRGRPGYAFGALLVAAACTIVLTTGLSTEWVDHLDRRTGGELLLVGIGICAPLAALLFTPPPRPR
jgi:multisubunit Na+/H+ antiporter MnhB subunit